MTAMRGIARNAAFSFAGQAAPLVVGAATIPFTIRWLDPERFGVLALVWVVVGYLGVFDLGLGRATTRFVAAARGDREADVSSVIWTAALAQAALGTVGAALVWATAPLLVHRVLDLGPGLSGEASMALSLLAISAPVLMVSTSLRGALEAARRFDLVGPARAVLGSLSFLLPLVSAGAGWGLPAIVLSILLLHVTGLVVLAMMCARVFPRLTRFRINVGMLRRLLRFGGWVSVSSAAGPLIVYLDRFAIAVLVSVAAVGQYAAPAEVVSRLSIIPFSLVAVLFPVFSSERLASRAREALAARSVRTLVLVMGAVTVALVALAHDVVRVWLGPQLVEAVAVPLQILAVGMFLNALAYVPYSLLQAVDRPDLTGKLHLLELPLHAVLVWLLVSRWGLVGAALAWTIRGAADAVLLFAAAARLGHLRYRALSVYGVPSLVGAVLTAALVAAGISTVSGAALRLVAVGLVLGGAALALLPADLARAARGLLRGSSVRP